MEDYKCPALNILPNSARYKPCSIHKLSLFPSCAVRNAYMLKSWLLHQQFSEKEEYEGFDEIDNSFNTPQYLASLPSMDNHTYMSMYN